VLWNLRIYLYFGYFYACIVWRRLQRGLRFEFALNLSSFLSLFPSSCGVSFFCYEPHLGQSCLLVCIVYLVIILYCRCISNICKPNTLRSCFFFAIWGQGEEGRLIIATLLLLDVVWGDFSLVQAFASALPTTSQPYTPFCNTLCLIWGRPYQRVYVWYLGVKQSTHHLPWTCWTSFVRLSTQESTWGILFFDRHCDLDALPSWQINGTPRVWLRLMKSKIIQ